jgi:hypothetical protein
MSERDRDLDVDVREGGVNPGYAAYQISKAFTTSEEHADPAARERAKEKIAKWETVFKNILSGALQYGSRTPVAGVPEWVTLEVVTGGFATGQLLAGGPLQEHEKKQLETLGQVAKGDERRALNAYFLSDSGLGLLQDRLRTGCYDVDLPEEGALLVAAWLVQNGYAEDARQLLDQLSSFLSTLRFYPIPLEQPRRFGPRVHLQVVAKTLEDLRRIKPKQRIVAQKEAVEIWTPLYDRIVALFLETVENGWPCQVFPDRWPERALALLGTYVELKKERPPGRRFAGETKHQAQLRNFLGKCASNPRSLTGREVGRIRLILNSYVAKRGAPGSPTCAQARQRQMADVSAPTFHAIAGVVIPRFNTLSPTDGVDDVIPLEQDVTTEETLRTGIPAGTAVPMSIRRKIERCLNETAEVLVERGLITSGESLAKVLTQMTSGLRAAGIAEPALRHLYAAIYRAFRRRRSLLLMNLQKQVQFEALPWVAAIDRFRSESLPTRDLARHTLEELTTLTFGAFPYAIIPNKLVQELRALVKGADLDIPLVDELAADIFMGEFSGKFNESANRAADLLEASLYAVYYDIDYKEVREIPPPPKKARQSWLPWRTRGVGGLAELCAVRAGVTIGTWDPATNGMIIEQQQILTTQNLAALFVGLDLRDALRGQLDDMAKRCLQWICKRLQMKADKGHARLIMLKNAAYAWRQMIFFLSLRDHREVDDFLQWAEVHLGKQTEAFRSCFRPALKGLALAASGKRIEDIPTSDARRFLGWSKTRHWLFQVGDGERD